MQKSRYRCPWAGHKPSYYFLKLLQWANGVSGALCWGYNYDDPGCVNMSMYRYTDGFRSLSFVQNKHVTIA